jgi:hypothetical protein
VKGPPSRPVDRPSINKNKLPSRWPFGLPLEYSLMRARPACLPAGGRRCARLLGATDWVGATGWASDFAWLAGMKGQGARGVQPVGLFPRFRRSHSPGNDRFLIGLSFLFLAPQTTIPLKNQSKTPESCLSRAGHSPNPGGCLLCPCYTCHLGGDFCRRPS